MLIYRKLFKNIRAKNFKDVYAKRLNVCSKNVLVLIMEFIVILIFVNVLVALISILINLITKNNLIKI